MEYKVIDGKGVIPDGATDVGEGAFKNCVGLQSVVIPDSVTKIWSSAFEDCLSYTDLEYQVADFYLYPEAEYIIQLADDTFAFAIILIIPYLVYSFFNICKTSYSKIQNMHHEG